MAWTRISDCHSGGAAKIKWDVVYIPRPEDEARKLFAEAFSRDPNHVTCDCCGADFFVMEEDDLDEAIAWDEEHLIARDKILVLTPPG